MREKRYVAPQEADSEELTQYFNPTAKMLDFSYK